MMLWCDQRPRQGAMREMLWHNRMRDLLCIVVLWSLITHAPSLFSPRYLRIQNTNIKYLTRLFYVCHISIPLLVWICGYPEYWAALDGHEACCVTLLTLRTCCLCHSEASVTAKKVFSQTQQLIRLCWSELCEKLREIESLRYRGIVDRWANLQS